MIHPAHDAMRLLLDRAEDKLTHDDLRALAMLTESAADAALDLSRVAGGVACLIAGDEANGTAGNFRNADDAFALLSHVASALDCIAGLVAVGDTARSKLAAREAA